MQMARILLVKCLSFVLILSCFPAEAAPKRQRPRLILVIVIDQFRSDYLTRFESRFLPEKTKDGVGGFRYLMNQGAYFPHAQYGILQSMTGPGHAMILSGAYPYNMGIPLNEWYVPKLDRKVYCAEDESAELIGAKGMGMSPKNLTGTTVGDELKNAGYPSKIVSLALKDRSAILMAGHRADFVFWFDQEAFQWISSRYYIKSGGLPPWLETLNKEILGRKQTSYVWESKEKPTGFSQPIQKGEFQRKAVIGDKASTQLPFGVEITTQAAKRALLEFKLGTDEYTDILAVSYSSHDYLGHQTGPNAREMEEMTVFEDRSISELLTHVQKTVPGGLKDVVIALTADHGTAPYVPYLQENKIEAGTLVDKDLRALGEEALIKKFGRPTKKWILGSESLNYWLNEEEVTSKKVSFSEVQAELKRTLQKAKGVAHVFTRADFEARILPPGMHQEQILKTYHPKKSGDVVIIPEPFFHEKAGPAMHMTGYSYDGSVPLILVGSRFKAGEYATPAKIVDLAPTLTFLSGTLPPALNEGRVLHEAIK